MLTENRKTEFNKILENLVGGIVGYLSRVQVMDQKSGYYGSFYSEKAYHFPALDYNAGGSHHFRTVGSAGLGFLLLSRLPGRESLAKRGETAFDWVVRQQCADGGFYEISNNDIPSLHWWSEPDYSKEYPYPRSTIETAFIVYGLAQSISEGLIPAKKEYMDCLEKAAEWQLNMERPKGSGVFVHDESHLTGTVDCLNADILAALVLSYACRVLKFVRGEEMKQLEAVTERAVCHVIGCQEENGEFRYLAHEGRTISYTAVVVDALLKIGRIMPLEISARQAICKSVQYLRTFVMDNGKIDWKIETSAARYGTGAYLETANILLLEGYGEDSYKLVKYCEEHLYDPAIGLLSVNDREKEQVYHSAPFQADSLVGLLEMRDSLAGSDYGKLYK